MTRQEDRDSILSNKEPTSSQAHDLGSADFLANGNLFMPEFGLEITHKGFLNPQLKSYLVSLKYNFEELRKHDWIHDSLAMTSIDKIPVINIPRGDMSAHFYKMLSIAKFFTWLRTSPANSSVVYPDLEPYLNSFIDVESACTHVNSMYYDGTMDMKACIKTFNYHYDHNIWSYFTLHLIKDVLDIGSKELLLEKGHSNFLNKHVYMSRYTPYTYKPVVYKLFLNVTIQYMNIRFSRTTHNSTIEFEREIDYVLDEVNSYIPRFTTRSATPNRREKRAVLAALFTIGSGLFSAWRFYKDYTFKRNLKRTLHYILNENSRFRAGILSNRQNLLSLADITASNFKDLHAKFADLKSITMQNFRHYTESLINTNSDVLFYRNYLLYYIDTLGKVNSDLALYTSRLDTAKSILYTKCRTFISGLHTLAENKIPESILHADVFNNILKSVGRILHHDTDYELLYGDTVNPYYHMQIVKSFIINNALYMNIMLPLKHFKIPIMNLYNLKSHYLPTNMSTDLKEYGSYTKLDIAYPYIAYNGVKLCVFARKL